MDKFVVRSVDGSVDVVASTAAYHAALTEWVSLNETPSSELETAVNAVFESESRGPIPTAALVSMAAHRLTTDPNMFVAVSKRVHDWIKNQVTQGVKFTVVRGKGGGVVRTSAA